MWRRADSHLAIENKITHTRFSDLLIDIINSLNYKHILYKQKNSRFYFRNDFKKFWYCRIYFLSVFWPNKWVLFFMQLNLQYVYYTESGRYRNLKCLRLHTTIKMWSLYSRKIFFLTAFLNNKYTTRKPCFCFKNKIFTFKLRFALPSLVLVFEFGTFLGKR